MDYIIVNIDPADGRINSVHTQTDSELQQTVLNNPSSFITITDTNTIRAVIGAMGVDRHSPVLAQESTVHLIKGAVIKKPNISVIKANKINQMYQACNEQCCVGVTVDALGAPYFYPTQLLDQQNLAASVTASLNPNNPVDWTVVSWCCTPNEPASWALRDHTASQIQAVGDAVLRHIEAQRIKLRSITTTIGTLPNSATEENANLIRSIVWA